jgi:hypothetical protein
VSLAGCQTVDLNNCLLLFTGSQSCDAPVQAVAFLAATTATTMCTHVTQAYSVQPVRLHLALALALCVDPIYPIALFACRLEKICCLLSCEIWMRLALPVLSIHSSSRVHPITEQLEA